MNFMRGLADGMDFYCDEKNKDRVIKDLVRWDCSSVIQELEELRRSESQATLGMPDRHRESDGDVIANEKTCP